MKKTEYSRMAHHERTYWWHLGRLKIINTYIANHASGKKNMKILNVGCGTGGTLNMLEKFGAVENVDVSDEAIAFMKKSGYKVKKVEGIKLPYKDNTFDLVGAFDVLEHIEHDEDALKEWLRVLKPGGFVVMTIPAHQWLWSDHDVSLHHFRRYTTKEVKNKAKNAGLHPKRVSYAIAFSVPLIIGFRVMNKLLNRKVDSETSYVPVPKFVNSFFTNLLTVEAASHKVIKLPIGTSVIASLEKKT